MKSGIDIFLYSAILGMLIYIAVLKYQTYQVVYEMRQTTKVIYNNNADVHKKLQKFIDRAIILDSIDRELTSSKDKFLEYFLNKNDH